MGFSVVDRLQDSSITSISSSSGRGESVLLACSEVGHADLASLPIDSEMLVMPLS
jgi:hypothetical protein